MFTPGARLRHEIRRQPSPPLRLLLPSTPHGSGASRRERDRRRGGRRRGQGFRRGRQGKAQRSANPSQRSESNSNNLFIFVSYKFGDLAFCKNIKLYIFETFTCMPLKKMIPTCVPLKRLLAPVCHQPKLLCPLRHSIPTPSIFTVKSSDMWA
jgi:hypothetical protein